MFEEALRRQKLEALLTDRPFCPFPAAGDAAWQNLPGRYRAEIEKMAEEYGKVPYPMRLATGFLQFVRTGDRQADEEPYFLRRRKLVASVLALCTGQGGAEAVLDGVFCICEESSWVISAHNVNPIPGAPKPAEFPLPDPEKPYVDLFCAQTGMILMLTLHLAGKALDEISPMIRARILREIKTRILVPFMDRDDFWWMGWRRKDLNNWTPWIVSQVLLAACLYPMDRSDRARLLERACGMLDRWLQVVPEDGGCDEGVGYFNMAGASLLDCLQILSEVTKGRFVFWDDRKLQGMMRFPLRMEIGGGWFVNFADCDARPFLSGERLQYAGEQMQDAELISMGRRLRGTLSDQIRDVPHFHRLLLLLFHPAGEEPEQKRREGDEWLPDTQVRLVRRGAYVLCCKGGHNGENHNHNDVGSFMLYRENVPEIVDAGNMTYTAITFSEKRYTLWNVRSLYHNLPVIDGAEQEAGAEHQAGRVRCLQDGLALDLSAAYPKAAGILSWERTMRLGEGGMQLQEEWELDGEKDLTFVFMLASRPKLMPGQACFGGIRLLFPGELQTGAEELPVTDPRMARNFPGSLWRLCLTFRAKRQGRIRFELCDIEQEEV